jgi:hypothetical protein
VLSDCGPDTPDSSIKEEPSEEASEGAGGVLVCRWRNCGREFTDKKYLVSSVTFTPLTILLTCLNTW